MKYLKYKLIAMILGFNLIISSCKDYLEMQPINQTSGNEFWTSKGSSDQALAGAYALLRKALLNGGSDARFMLYGEYNGNIMKHYGYTNADKFNDASFWNSDGDEFKWGTFYQIIAQCNLILLKTKELDESLFKNDKVINGKIGKQKILGEAYFLRAFTYFYLTKVWGDVPLVTDAVVTVGQIITKDGYIKNVPRDPEIKVLEQCIADLKLAGSYLEYGKVGSDEWAVRANKGAVQALMAHIYLWMHKPAESEVAADSVIQHGGYSLVDYSDSMVVMHMFTGRSTEGIFELNINYDQSESYTYGFGQSTLVKPWLYNKEFDDDNWVVQKDYMSSLYEGKDLRIKRFFGLWDEEKPIILKYADIIYENPAEHINAHSNNNIILFRLSDIFLLRSEALANLGRFSEARILLNTIRERAGATPNTGPDADLQYAIFQEREMELIGEGHTFFDRIRGNEWTNIDWMTISRKELKGYYWPLPSSYIINNPLLTQNPFWAYTKWQ